MQLTVLRQFSETKSLKLHWNKKENNNKKKKLKKRKKAPQKKTGWDIPTEFEVSREILWVSLIVESWGWGVV